MDQDTRRELKREVQRLVKQTDLSQRQATVLAADKRGLPDKDVSLLICRSEGTVERIRDKIIARGLELDAEIDTARTTKEEIEETY